MAGISSLGIGSGVLTADLVEKLANAERAPVEKRLNFQQERTEAMISAYGKLRSAVTEMRLPMRMLSSPENLKAFSATSSNENVLVTADSKKVARGSYSVKVDSMAQAQSLASPTFADKDKTPLGTGKLTIAVGDKTKTLTIDSSNNTLQGLATQLNEAGIGVTASVIDTGSGFRLVMSSEQTGTANAISITAADDATGLSQFNFNDTEKNLTETVAAKDAVLQVNGITITRSTNTIENVVEGLKFEIKAEGVTSTVKVEQDTGAVADRVQAFVEKFNSLQQTIRELTGVNGSGEGSLLTGDSTIRSIQNQLRSAVTSMVPGLTSSAIRSLADVGIASDYKTGELQFDRAKFEDQLRKNPDDVTALFAEQGRSSDAQVEFVKAGLNSKPGDYAVNITQLATQGGLVGASVGVGNVTIGADNDELTFSVDGGTTAKISLTVGTYTREELAAEIQRQLNVNTALSSTGKSVAVKLDAATGALSFSSGTYGSKSNVSLIAVDTNSAADLGLSVGTGTPGKNVAGTIGGREATGEGQLLTVKGGGADGMQIRITGGETGNRGSISFIEGIAERTVNLVSSIVGTDGALTGRADRYQKELNKIADERLKLNERIESLSSRLSKQFAIADRMISQLQSTGNYITAQLDALNASNKK